MPDHLKDYAPNLEKYKAVIKKNSRVGRYKSQGMQK
jgi:hypothetical protein